jgi:hypothetical protein
MSTVAIAGDDNLVFPSSWKFSSGAFSRLPFDRLVL